jgi:hypothetical protein
VIIILVGGLEPWNPKSAGKALGFGDSGKKQWDIYSEI